MATLAANKSSRVRTFRSGMRNFQIRTRVPLSSLHSSAMLLREWCNSMYTHAKDEHAMTILVSSETCSHVINKTTVVKGNSDRDEKL